MLMKIHIIPCIGKFYNFVVMITVTLNKLSILGINVALNTCLMRYIFSIIKLAL